MKKISRLFVTSISISFILFLAQLYRENKNNKLSNLPMKDENMLLDRYAIEATRIRLFSQQISSSIGWDKEEKYAGELSLKISIRNNDAALNDYYHGINFLLPLDLSPFKNSGLIEFHIKGGINYSHILFLDLILRDRFDTQLKIHILKFIDLSDQWQHFSLPLTEFLKEGGRYWSGSEWLARTFDWNQIGSVAFLISLVKDCNNVEIFIDDFVIKDNNSKIFDLCSYYE